MFKKQSWSCNTPYQKMLEIYNDKDLNKDNRLFNSEPTNYLLGQNTELNFLKECNDFRKFSSGIWIIYFLIFLLAYGVGFGEPTPR